MAIGVTVYVEPAAGGLQGNFGGGAPESGWARYIDIPIPAYNHTVTGDTYIVVVHVAASRYDGSGMVMSIIDPFINDIMTNGRYPGDHGQSMAFPTDSIINGTTGYYPYANWIFSQFIAGGFSGSVYSDPGGVNFTARDVTSVAVDRWEIIPRPQGGKTYRVLLDGSFAQYAMDGNPRAWSPAQGVSGYMQSQNGHACVFVVTGVEYNPFNLSTQSDELNPTSLSGTNLYFSHQEGCVPQGDPSTNWQTDLTWVTRGVGSTQTLNANHSALGTTGIVLSAGVTFGPLTANPTYSSGETNAQAFTSSKKGEIAGGGWLGYTPVTSSTTYDVMVPFHVSFTTKTASSTGNTVISRTRPTWGPFTQDFGDNNLIDQAPIRLSALYIKPHAGNAAFSGKDINKQPAIGAGFLNKDVAIPYYTIQTSTSTNSAVTLSKDATTIKTFQTHFTNKIVVFGVGQTGYPQTMAVHPSGNMVYVPLNFYTGVSPVYHFRASGTHTLEAINTWRYDQYWQNAAVFSYPSKSLSIDSTGKFLISKVDSGSGFEIASINQSTYLLNPTPAVQYSGNTYSSSSIIASPTKNFCYMSSGISPYPIKVFSLDTTTGVISLASTVAGTGQSSSSLAIDPTGRFLYAISSIYIKSYLINQTTGALTLSATTTLAQIPNYDTNVVNYFGDFDKTGKFLLIRQYANSVNTANSKFITPIMSYEINQTTGALTFKSSLSMANVGYPFWHINCLCFDICNSSISYFYVLRQNEILECALDMATGQMQVTLAADSPDSLFSTDTFSYPSDLYPIVMSIASNPVKTSNLYVTVTDGVENNHVVAMSVQQSLTTPANTRTKKRITDMIELKIYDYWN